MATIYGDHFEPHSQNGANWILKDQEFLAAAMSLNSICHSTFGFIGSDLNGRVALQTECGSGIVTN